MKTKKTYMNYLSMKLQNLISHIKEMVSVRLSQQSPVYLYAKVKPATNFKQTKNRIIN